MPITGFTFLFGTLSLTAVPFTSGFFSKEGILKAAENSPLLYIAVGVAALTTFYMFRLFFIAFCGESRDHGAKEAKEVSPLMWGPLAILAVFAAASPWFSNFFPTNNVSKIHVSAGIHWGDTLVIMSLLAFAVGFAAAFILYKGKDKDPINIPLFRNKFYIDEFYAGIVKWFQDILAAVVHFLDEFIINGMLVGGFTRIAQGTGNLFRKYGQSGNLQHYAFISGAGILLAIYFTVFGN
jgi:NADH-quinone oxidoreductase subunit L